MRTGLGETNVGIITHKNTINNSVTRFMGTEVKLRYILKGTHTFTKSAELVSMII